MMNEQMTLESFQGFDKEMRLDRPAALDRVVEGGRNIDFSEILEILGKKYFSTNRRFIFNYYTVVGNTLAGAEPVKCGEGDGLWTSKVVFKSRDEYSATIEVMEAAPNGCMYGLTVELVLQCDDNRMRYLKVSDLKIGTVKKITQLPITQLPINEPAIVNRKEELVQILKNKDPYLYSFWAEHKSQSLRPETLLIAPQIEQIYKMGMKIGEAAVRTNGFNGSDRTMFNRLTKPGKNPKEIFKTSKAVYKALWDEKDLSVWDEYRKMDKFGRISQSDIQRLYESGCRNKDLALISQILSYKKENGEQLFSLTTLTQYLERLDMFEAIDRMYALPLLRDYLQLCKAAEIEPRIDGDSLKREHDIAARIARSKRDEIVARKMLPACQKNAKYDYAESVFFIRHVRDYDDLLDEAKQQHNCLAGYPNSIIKGRSLIFVMREISKPDQSLVSVEIDRCGNIRQKYLAYNQPIRNKSITEFLERFERRTKAIMRGEATSESTEKDLPTQLVA